MELSSASDRRNRLHAYQASLLAVPILILLLPLAGHAAPPAGCAAATMNQEGAVATIDTDSDGLSDHDERCIHGTDPAVADTDGDGHVDGVEVRNGFSPRFADKRMADVDSDGDHLNDAWELKIGTGLMDPDSDGDLYLDGTEVAASFDPLAAAGARQAKRIVVDRSGLRLAYYFGDTKLDEIPVSPGKASTPTPLGTFAVTDKIPVKRYRGATYDFPGTKWNLRFATAANGMGYYIHGAYWHDKFGRAAVSSGCVNVRYEDMERLYWFAQHGTPIVIE